jgi:hypothetical protein
VADLYLETWSSLFEHVDQLDIVELVFERTEQLLELALRGLHLLHVLVRSSWALRRLRQLVHHFSQALQSCFVLYVWLFGTHELFWWSKLVGADVVLLEIARVFYVHLWRRLRVEVVFFRRFFRFDCWVKFVTACKRELRMVIFVARNFRDRGQEVVLFTNRHGCLVKNFVEPFFDRGAWVSAQSFFEISCVLLSPLDCTCKSGVLRNLVLSFFSWSDCIVLSSRVVVPTVKSRSCVL